MRTWMRLIPAVLLAVPLTWSPLRADAETNAKKIEDLQRDVAKLQKELKDLKEEVRTNSVRGAQVAGDVQQIKELLERMAKQQGTMPRESFYGPRPNGAMPTTGTIVLQNDFSAPAIVHINGQSFEVRPYQTQKVQNVPVGTFQYSVDVQGFGIVEPTRRESLRPGGYRIQIYPRLP